MNNKRLRTAFFDAAVKGELNQCDQYVICINRGESQAVVKPRTTDPLCVMCALYAATVYTRKTFEIKVLDVDPNRILKFYYHVMQGGVQTLVIGILTGEEQQEFIIEEVL